MMGQVVAFPGYSVPTPKGEPITSVVEILKEYLEKAEAGQIQGVGIAVILGDGTVGAESLETDFSSASGFSWALYAAIGRLHNRINGHTFERIV